MRLKKIAQTALVCLSHRACAKPVATFAHDALASRRRADAKTIHWPRNPRSHHRPFGNVAGKAPRSAWTRPDRITALVSRRHRRFRLDFASRFRKSVSTVSALFTGIGSFGGNKRARLGGPQTSEPFCVCRRRMNAARLAGMPADRGISPACDAGRLRETRDPAMAEYGRIRWSAETFTAERFVRILAVHPGGGPYVAKNGFPSTMRAPLPWMSPEACLAVG